YGERHGQFVADHLRGAAQAAQKRVLVVGSPAAERDAIDAHGGNREDDEQTDIDVGELHVGLDAEDFNLCAEGDDGDRNQGEGDGEKRREEVIKLVDLSGDDAFFGD